MNSPNSVNARNYPNDGARDLSWIFWGSAATGRDPCARSAGHRTLGRTEARAGVRNCPRVVLNTSSDCRLRCAFQSECGRPESPSDHFIGYKVLTLISLNLVSESPSDHGKRVNLLYQIFGEFLNGQTCHTNKL